MLFIFFIFFQCYLSSCKNTKIQSPISKLTLQERQCIEDFFYEILFFEGGVYTLFGTKPMTEILIYHSDYSTPEMYEHLNTIWKNPNTSQISIIENHLAKDWAIWEKFSKYCYIKNYLFIKRPFMHQNLAEGRKFESLFFVNIHQTEFILNRYYKDFKKIIGYDFNPKQIIYELQNPSSHFWQAVLSHDALKGILFGFGYVNSWIYYWKNLSIEKEKNSENYLNKIHFFDSEPNAIIYPTTIDFSIPQFKYIDPYPIEKYQRQKKEIQKIYKDVDFLETTLEKLLSK